MIQPVFPARIIVASYAVTDMTDVMGDANRITLP